VVDFLIGHWKEYGRKQLNLILSTVLESAWRKTV